MESINDYIPQSPDHNAERLQKLKELFPDLFTVEGKIDEKELQKLVNPENIHETERYEFRWFGKSQAKRNAFTPTNATFIFDENRSVNPENTENIIIEGDNLDSLKLLSNAYREKIKCIYIDPPYNTGKDFVYSDNFTQDKKAYWEDAGIVENGVKIDTNTETDGRFHSNWLNMMYSRLLIARQLLREDGVIFISIDDNEVHHLRKLCDEVFGENNFLVCLPTVMNLKGNNDQFGFAGTHEYTIVYLKNIECGTIGEFNIDEEELEIWEEDEYGLYKQGANLKATGTNAPREKRPNLFFPLYIKNNEVSLQKLEGYTEVFPITNNQEMSWRWSKNKFIEEMHNLIINSNNQEFSIYKKQRPELGDLPTKKPKSIFYKPSYSSGNGTQELKQFFSERFFSNPKPKELIKDFLILGSQSNDIILDFFAGSGTTGQAVMELNKEDGGNRKFILIQLPEQTDENSEAYKNGYKKISDITIERNKRVIEKIVNEEKEKYPDLFTEENQTNIGEGLGFKVFKLSKSNFPRVEFAPNPEKTDEENVEDLKKYISEKESQLVNAFNREELLTEILVKRGFNLNYKTIPQPQFTKNDILLATDGNKEAFITLDVVIAEETVNYFKENISLKFICLERALDTTKKFNLKHYLGEMFDAF